MESAIYRSETAAVFIHSGEQRSREQRCFGVGNDWGRGNGARNELSKAIAKATFRVGSITLPPTSLSSAQNQASATGENPCVHQSYYGWADGVGLGLCADRRTECGCLALQVGMASGGFRVALELERTDTVGSPEVPVRQAEMETRR